MTQDFSNNTSQASRVTRIGLVVTIITSSLFFLPDKMPIKFQGQQANIRTINTNDEVMCSREDNDEKEETYHESPSETSPMCQRFAHTSPASIWKSNIRHIHEASRLSKDHNYNAHDLTAELLHLVSPRLASSIRTLERDTKKIELLLKKANARFNYIKDELHESRNVKERDASSPDMVPPTIEILVLGGSVTRGKFCVVDGVEGVEEEECSWPARLESFLNNIAGGRLVNVHNMARGASNTQVANLILQYSLMPAQAQQPDIVISAASTNDAFIEDRERGSEAQQELIRRVLRWNPCEDDRNQPILLDFDDWLGGFKTDLLALDNDQHIKHLMNSQMGADTLSRYYGIASMSYANMVRDWVYGDTHEYFFTPSQWYNEEDDEFHTQVHPGQSMHITSSWVVAYNLVNMIGNYCEFESWKVAELERTMKYSHDGIPGMPELRSREGSEGKPRPKPESLPPPLTIKLTLQDISENWRNGTQNSSSLQSDAKAACSGSVRCPFKWWFGDYGDYGEMMPSDMQARFNYTEQLFAPFVKSQGAWQMDLRSEKLSWRTEELGSEMVLVFPSFSQPINEVTFLFLKSYGAWTGSTAQVKFSTRSQDDQKWSGQAKTHLYGFHEKKTSEIYGEQFKLPSVIPGGTSLRMGVKLVNGTSFQLMGVMICLA